MNPITISAPAKLNLSLRVLGKRADGFHELDTLMIQVPELADEILISPADAFSFSCDQGDIPDDASNLVVRAVRDFDAEARVDSRFSIHLVKRIPHGAGLGGGSSDAAATLLALNEIHHQPLSHERLVQVAARIGSDVPFFLGKGAMRCQGRGEILIDAQALPAPLPVLILKPSFGVATPDAYSRWQHSKELAFLPYQSQQLGDLEIVNDLERPVFEKHRFLGELKQWLLFRSEIRCALLSGSGSSMFAILHQGADADKLAKAARQELDPTLWYWHGLTGI